MSYDPVGGVRGSSFTIEIRQHCLDFDLWQRIECRMIGPSL